MPCDVGCLSKVTRVWSFAPLDVSDKQARFLRDDSPLDINLSEAIRGLSPIDRLPNDPFCRLPFGANMATTSPHPNTHSSLQHGRQMTSASEKGREETEAICQLAFWWDEPCESLLISRTASNQLQIIEIEDNNYNSNW